MVAGRIGKVRAYYNEFDPMTAAWLRELIHEGLITPGDVDERDIREVSPTDLLGYDHVHFFAGIGGWDYALDLAGWPDDQPVWTGSCPCQPFSTAGKQKAQDDDRHLWPAFFRLIRECRPYVVFGEQVEGAIRYGWLDGLQTDLEGEGYAVGHCVLGAHSIGADHIRQRLYWLADSGYPQSRDVSRSPEGNKPNRDGSASQFTGCGLSVGVGDSASAKPGLGELRLHAISSGGDGNTAEQKQPDVVGVVPPRQRGITRTERAMEQ